MKCKKKRTVFELFEIFTCENCQFKKEDKQIIIGNNLISIYHLFNNCEAIEIDVDYLIFDCIKLKILLKDAIIYDSEIMFIFIEDFNLEQYYDVFSGILDNELSIQIVTF